ncbi:hypothetical protein CC79DRAFT_1371089 [Sarocladium strictum]
MPPLPRGRPAGTGPSALEVSNANNTVNTFLGARQPSWLTGSSAPSTSFSKNTTSQSWKPAARTSVSAPEGMSQVQDVEANSIPISVLPSPAPTNDMSPTTSHAGGSPAPANHTLQEQPTAATGQTMQRPSLTGYGGTLARKLSSSDSPVASAVGQSYHPQSDVHHAPSHHSMATSQDAPTSSSAVRPILHNGVSSSSSIATSRSMVTESSVVRAGSKRTISNTNSSAPTAKRLDVGSRVPDGAPRIASSLLLQSVERQIASWASLNDPENRALRQRYELLKLAASEGDWWFLTVHCLYSQTKFNKRAFCEALHFAELGSDLVNVQTSFELLTPLLPSPQDLDPRHLRWFALFPADDVRKLQQFAPQRDFNEAMAFLRLFGRQWQYWVTTSSLRGYPLTAHELLQMHCTSPRMQLLLLTNNAHQLGALSGLSELYQGLIEDRAFEGLVSSGSVTYDQIAMEFAEGLAKYHSLHQKLRSPRRHTNTFISTKCQRDQVLRLRLLIFSRHLYSTRNVNQSKWSGISTLTHMNVYRSNITANNKANHRLTLAKCLT